MNGIYDMLNDVKTDLCDMKRVDFSEFEKKNIYMHLRNNKRAGNKSFAWKKKAAAVAVILCAGGLSVPVAAKVTTYINENLKNNFKVAVDKEVKAEGLDVKVVSVARKDETVEIVCDLNFGENIDALMKESDEACSVYGNLFNPVSKSPFKNCYVSINGKNDAYYEENNINNPYSIRCLNVSREGDNLRQKIVILADEISDFDGNPEIEVVYRDIGFGGKVLKGEWSYNHTLTGDDFADGDLVKSPISISGTDVQGNQYELTEYAFTQNGLILYGIAHEVLMEQELDFTKNVDIRLHITDNLGNEYLMYQTAPNIYEDIGNPEEDPYFEVEPGKVYDIHNEYSLYDGPALSNEAGKNYQTEWNPDATEYTIVIEQVTESFDETGKKYLGTAYENISEPCTIRIAE